MKYCSHKSRRADHRQLDKYEKGVYKHWVEEDMNAEFEEAEEEESVEESTRTSADRMRRVKAKMTLTCPLGKPSGNEDDSDQESESPSDIDNKSATSKKTRGQHKHDGLDVEDCLASLCSF